MQTPIVKSLSLRIYTYQPLDELGIVDVDRQDALAARSSVPFACLRQAMQCIQHVAELLSESVPPHE
jgi:hypothetical protein